MLSGEAQAWVILGGLDPEDIGSRAGIGFDRESGSYILESFAQDIFISLKDKRMFGSSPISDCLLHKLGRYSRLSVLYYLIGARDIPLSGKLVKPDDMSGGLIYLKGTHALPLDKLAERYGSDISGFLNRGRELGGEPLSYGDASLRLFPFPVIPVVLIIWKGDDEFPPRANLLFDATCEAHLTSDVIWSTAMMSVLMMLG